MGNRKLYENNRTSHPSKIMVRIILNQLKSKAKRLLAEEHAGFSAGWSIVE
ncbi:hypothetical protein DPMN_125118 [Dreissena polymorpha]|uniref:Uncharacterized protein n=1 Tax=Dreissena polymorpha TaxID=45954 RepID=A0A9D4GXM9_DREPO|nr:hypothetical protein DPMN_125118 [Dreissena polymorpha]